MDLPQHPDADQPTPRGERDTRMSWAAYLIIGIVAVLIVVIVTLHLTGVIGRGGH